MNRLIKKGLSLFALSSFILGGCKGGGVSGSGGGSQNIVVQGSALDAAGIPLRSKNIQFRFLASGTNLFPTGVHGCSAGDNHAQGIQTLNVVTDGNGKFSLSAPVSGFVRATDETCDTAATQSDQLSTVDIKAQLDADSASCTAYCSGSSDSSCNSNCLSHSQKFVWTKTLGTGDLANLKTQSVSSDIRFGQLGPPINSALAASNLPDLQVDGVSATTSIGVVEQSFASDACELQDQCIGAPGNRKLLKFNGVLQNLGVGDLIIGDPTTNPIFTFSVCHGHYHTKIMDYQLLDPVTGAVVTTGTGSIIGRKNGFCIEDMDQVAGTNSGKYTCENQGLTSGWADIYDKSLSCQWIDVTGVPTGTYILRVTVNPDRVFSESDYSNNSTEVRVNVP